MSYQQKLFTAIHSVIEDAPADQRKAMADAVFKTFVALEGGSADVPAAQILVDGQNIAGDLHHQWMEFIKV